jgi:uncharacterized protein YjbJ (UPF0337 family)
MNWDRISGKWTDFKGKVRERWAKLTDDDLARIQGKRDQLLGVLQERYGWVREQAERQIKDFESTAETEYSGSGAGGMESGRGSESGRGMSGRNPGSQGGTSGTGRNTPDDEDNESFQSR